MNTLKIAILFFLIVNLGNCQEIIPGNQSLTLGSESGYKHGAVKTLSEISVNLDVGFPKAIGEFKSICTLSKLSFDVGVKALLKDRYNIFLNFEYMFYNNENHPATVNHFFQLKNFTTGVMYRVLKNENTKIDIGLGLGPYIYERSKDDEGDWEVGVDEVCFGGKILASISTPLGKYFSLEFKPSINAFKSNESGWLSYITASAGLNIIFPI